MIHAQYKGEVIRATFSCNLSRNNVALQVATCCCTYYHPLEQLVTQQISMLQVASSMNESNATIGQLQIKTNKMAAAHLLQRKRAVAVLFLTLFAEEEENRPKKRNRKQYVREWIARREERGIYHQLVKELEVEDHAAYQNFFRLTKGQFLFLVEKLKPLIEKQEQPSPINIVRSTIKPDE